MPQKNTLLEEVIQKEIQEARYVEPKAEKKRGNWFYKLVVLLVTIAVLFSLLRYLGI